jgi:iron complex transport system substrate-binding protein
MIAFDNISRPRKWVHRIDPDWAQRKVLSFGDTPPNVEAVASLRPDLVIQGSTWQKQVEQMAKVAKVVSFDFHSRSIVEIVELLGKSIGKEERAKELIKYLNQKTEFITGITRKIPREKRPRVVYQAYQNQSGGFISLRTCGNRAYQHRLIEAAGGINSGKNFPVVWQNVDTERLLTWNPDVMFMRNPLEGEKRITLEEMRNNPIMNRLTLVKDGRFYFSPDGEFSSIVDCPEGILGLEFMAKKLHPDKFAHLNLEKEVKEFYSLWYRCNLNDEEVRQILYP